MGELDKLLSAASAGASLNTLLGNVWKHARKQGAEVMNVRFFHASQPLLLLAHTFGRSIPALHRGLRETSAPSASASVQRVNLKQARGLNPYRLALRDAGMEYLHSIPIQTVQPLGTLDFAGTGRGLDRLDKEWLQGVAALLALVYERGQLVGRAVADREVKSRLRQENLQLREVTAQATPLPELVGESPVWLRLLAQIECIAPTDSTVFIRGETGTGKELVARAIHRLSKRCAKPFVAVNCGAFTRELISSELFGHERGAFTGAHERRLGRFCLAQGGTLFLDEVAELPSDVQVRLLRALQEREYERVGGTQTLRADVRIVAATHRDMETERTAGRFRDDLFYRLNVVPLFVPALRERRDDIPLLLSHFLRKAAHKFGKAFESLHPDAIAACKAYDWPGNVRELENLVERETILSKPPVFSLDPFKDAARETRQRAQALDDVIADHICATLRRTRGKVYGADGAANLLRLKPSTLQAKMRKLGIQRRES